MEQRGHRLTLPLRLRQITGSNVGPETTILTETFCDFPQSL